MRDNIMNAKQQYVYCPSKLKSSVTHHIGIVPLESF